MAGESDIGYDYTTAGWTCSLCGVFVGSGFSHDCEYSVGVSLAPKDEIIELLKRIVELLERGANI